MHTISTNLNVSFKRNRGSRIVCDTIFCISFFLHVFSPAPDFFLYIYTIMCVYLNFCVFLVCLFIYFSLCVLFSFRTANIMAKDEIRNRSNEADSVFRVYFLFIFYFFKGIMQCRYTYRPLIEPPASLSRFPFFQHILSKITQPMFCSSFCGENEKMIGFFKSSLTKSRNLLK